MFSLIFQGFNTNQSHKNLQISQVFNFFLINQQDPYTIINEILKKDNLIFIYLN